MLKDIKCAVCGGDEFREVHLSSDSYSVSSRYDLVDVRSDKYDKSGYLVRIGPEVTQVCTACGFVHMFVDVDHPDF